MVLVLVLVLVQMGVRMTATAVRAWSIPPACPSSAVHLSVLGRLVFHRDSRASTSGGGAMTINELREPCIMSVFALIVVAPTHRVRRRRRRRHRDQRVPALVFILVLVLRVGVGMCMHGTL